MLTTALGKIARRLSYVLRTSRFVLPLVPENGLLLPLRILVYEAATRRAPFTVRIEGVTFRVRSFSSDLQTIRASFGTEYTEVLAEAEAHDGAILDAGGHIGSAAIAFARRFPDRTVLSVEPAPENFALLLENVRPFQNIQAINAAVGPQDARGILHDLTGTGDGYALQGETDGTADSPGTAVRILSIPTLMSEAGLDRLSLVKVDIEGAELDLLADRPGWIAKCGVLCVELHDWIRPGCTRAYINATEGARRDLRCSGEKLVSVAL